MPPIRHFKGGSETNAPKRRRTGLSLTADSPLDSGGPIIRPLGPPSKAGLPRG